MNPPNRSKFLDDERDCFLEPYRLIHLDLTCLNIGECQREVFVQASSATDGSRRNRGSENTTGRRSDRTTSCGFSGSSCRRTPSDMRYNLRTLQHRRLHYDAQGIRACDEENDTQHKFFFFSLAKIRTVPKWRWMGFNILARFRDRHYDGHRPKGGESYILVS